MGIAGRGQEEERMVWNVSAVTGRGIRLKSCNKGEDIRGEVEVFWRSSCLGSLFRMG